MTHVQRIKEQINQWRSDSATPEDHKIDPARLCRIIEAIVIELADGLPENEIFSTIYKYAHLAHWKCTKNHPDWLDDFLRDEELYEKEFCSPNDKKKYQEIEKLNNEEYIDVE